MIPPLGRKHSIEMRLARIIQWRRLWAFARAYRGAFHDEIMFGVGAYEEIDLYPGYRHIPAEEVIIPAGDRVKLFQLPQTSGLELLFRQPEQPPQESFAVPASGSSYPLSRKQRRRQAAIQRGRA